MQRRTFLNLVALSPGALAAQGVAIRALTKAPQFHWFGYYDKLQFDASGRYVLGQQADFEGRSPRPEDQIRIGIIDTKDGDRWEEIGTSRAWNWQQGCMLQWMPKSDRLILWNDRVEGRFVCHIYDRVSRKKRTIPAPIYTLSPDGKTGIAPDFRRLNDCRPGYGYAGIPDPNATSMAPSDAGIWRIDMRSGKQDLLFSFADVVKIPHLSPYSNQAKHWFNHLLYSPDGSRFIFLHRWRGDKEGTGFSTRMFTVGSGGKDFYSLDPYNKTSHFIWRDQEHVLAWAWHPSLQKEKFYLYRDKTDKVEAIGADVMTVNGHCSYLPGNKWIINDTYPDKERLQHLYIYEVASGRRIALADLFSPPTYTGEWRTDLHPRFSPDGKKACVDSTHEGKGRQLYLVDFSELLSR